METLGQRVARLRAALGMSQQDLASATGVSQQAIQQLEADEVRRPRYIVELADALKTTIRVLKSAEPEIDFSQAVPMPEFPKDLPVYAGVKGGLDGEIIDLSHPAEWTVRPPSLVGVHGAAGIMVTGNSMEPRYLPGELVIWHPRRSLTKGCFVAIEFDDHTGVVKQWVSGDDKVVRVKQLNPPKTLTYPRAKVINAYRIIRGGEE